MRKGQRLHPATTRGRYNTQSHQRKRRERSEKKYIRSQKRPQRTSGKRKKKYNAFSEFIDMLIRLAKYLYRLFAK
jgi:hypothetical protein